MTRAIGLLILCATAGQIACRPAPQPATGPSSAYTSATEPPYVIRGVVRLRPGAVAPPGMSLQIVVIAGGERLVEQTLPDVRRWPLELEFPIVHWPSGGKEARSSLHVHVRGVIDGAPVLVAEPVWYDHYANFVKERPFEIELFPAVE